jgi:hypothetical protein
MADALLEASKGQRQCSDFHFQKKGIDIHPLFFLLNTAKIFLPHPHSTPPEMRDETKTQEGEERKTEGGDLRRRGTAQQ